MNGKGEKEKMSAPGYYLLDFIRLFMKSFVTEDIWNQIILRNKQNISVQLWNEAARFAQSPKLAPLTRSVEIHLLVKKIIQKTGHDNRRQYKICRVNTAYVYVECKDHSPIFNNHKENGQTCSEIFHYRRSEVFFYFVHYIFILLLHIL